VERYTNNTYGDHLGSAQLVTDWSGSIYEHLEYTPYGELWVDHATSEVGMNPTVFRFTGKELDVETGFYYYRARYLDPKTSRWISADPAMGEYIPVAPINDEAKKHNQNLPGMGGIFNLVNMHVYHYAGNNPVKLVDPDGRTPRSYKLSENRYIFSPDRSTRDGAADAVLSTIIPFLGSGVVDAISGSCGFRTIYIDKDDVLSTTLNGIGNLNDLATSLTTLAGAVSDVAQLALEVSEVATTIVTLGLTGIKAYRELNKQDSVGMDLMISKILGNALSASTHEGVAALYNYAKTRMDKLHQEGVFSYTTNKDGSIRSCSYRNSDFDSLRQELKLFKESIEK
jgi:RHS repeat-associated protein